MGERGPLQEGGECEEEVGYSSTRSVATCGAATYTQFFCWLFVSWQIVVNNLGEPKERFLMSKGLCFIFAKNKTLNCNSNKNYTKFRFASLRSDLCPDGLPVVSPGE